MTRRSDQVAQTIRRAVQDVLSEGLSDPRLEGLMLTVTEVTIDNDLTTAVVRVSVMQHEKENLALHALKAASRYIRREVGDRVSIHIMPELMFKLDEGLKRQAEVFKALADVRREQEARDALSGSSEGVPGGIDSPGTPGDGPSKETDS